MAAVTTERAAGAGSAPAAPAAARRSLPVWRWVILLIAGVYFLLPLYAALRFAGMSGLRRRCSPRPASAPRCGCRSGWPRDHGWSPWR